MTQPSSLDSCKAARALVAASADPAANNEFSLTVPAGKMWEVVAVTVALVQGATQTPQPILILDDGANVLYEMFGSSAAQAVSTTCRYTWAACAALTGQIGATTNVHSVAPLPAARLILPPGYRLRSSTLGIGANTDYGVARAFGTEYDL
jgi:hypothetical protein